MSAKTARKLALRNAERRDTVARVVEYMNSVEGRGWARRMEKRDHYMDQDYPTLWLSGRKLVSQRNLARLEAYASRFGYVSPRLFMKEIREITRSLSQFADS